MWSFWSPLADNDFSTFVLSTTDTSYITFSLIRNECWKVLDNTERLLTLSSSESYTRFCSQAFYPQPGILAQLQFFGGLGDRRYMMNYLIKKFHLLIYVTIAKETRLSAQNDISQEEVFDVWSARFRILPGGFHWKLWSIFFIRLRIENDRLRFFCGVLSWLWFVNMVPFHIRSWNKWTELFNLGRDKMQKDGWRSGWY